MRMALVQIAYNIDVVKSNIPEALEVLSDAVLNPRFTTWEVAEAVQKIEQDIKGLKENPQTVLLEVSILSTSPVTLHASLLVHLVLIGVLSSTTLAVSHASSFGDFIFVSVYSCRRSALALPVCFNLGAVPEIPARPSTDAIEASDCPRSTMKHGF